MTEFPLFDQLDAIQRDAHGPRMHLVLPAESEPPVTPEPTPEERRDTGIQRAAGHADRVQPVPKWSEQAEAFTRNWIDLHGDKPFLMEEVVETAKREGFPDPPDKRAYGGVIRKLAKSGIIRKVGYASARTSNASVKCLWLRTEF